jgi:hypothetical protein
MSASFHTHGLLGIDVHHVQAQSAARFGAPGSRSSLWSAMRRSLAALCLTAGTLLAGEEISRSARSQPVT